MRRGAARPLIHSIHMYCYTSIPSLKILSVIFHLIFSHGIKCACRGGKTWPGDKVHCLSLRAAGLDPAGVEVQFPLAAHHATLTQGFSRGGRACCPTYLMTFR